MSILDASQFTCSFYNKNLASQIDPEGLFSSSALYQVQALYTHANRACTFRFARPELGVDGVLKRKYC